MKKMEKRVQEFNIKYPVDSVVYWRNYGGIASEDEEPYVRHTVRAPAFITNGVPVVFFNERAGYCAIDKTHVKN